MIAIKTERLTKRFKKLVAVDDVSLEIQIGECFGLLGPNGAGKTSFIRMITGVSPPTSGKVWVLGKDLETKAQEIKALLGIVPQVDNLDPDLTVRQNLVTFARYFDIPRREALQRSNEVLALFKLEEKRDSRIQELSGGMKRRLLVARGLINRPRIIILDEPTIGLDPQSRHLVWGKLAELKAGGATQVLCTQNMEEAAVLCGRVAIMHLGKILSLDTPAGLIARYVGGEVWEITPEPLEKELVLEGLRRRHLVFEDLEDRIEVFRVQDSAVIREVAISIDSVKKRVATLEDVFLKLTGRYLTE